MIPLIGFMIGAYIITRMVELITNKQTHDTVGICAFITVAVVVVCLLGLLLNSTQGIDTGLTMPSLFRSSLIPGQ